MPKTPTQALIVWRRRTATARKRSTWTSLSWTPCLNATVTCLNRPTKCARVLIPILGKSLQNELTMLLDTTLQNITLRARPSLLDYALLEPFWKQSTLKCRQHMLAPVLEDDHTKTVVSSQPLDLFYRPLPPVTQRLARATSLEPRQASTNTTQSSHTETSATSRHRSSRHHASTFINRRRSSLSRLYWRLLFSSPDEGLKRLIDMQLSDGPYF